MHSPVRPALPAGCSRASLYLRVLGLALAALAFAQSVSATVITRPWGLDYTPSYVPTYDPATDIPADALDRSAYGSTAAWLAACVTANKPGKIGSGTYNVGSADLKVYAPKGIYGYGTTRPIFNYTDSLTASTPGYLYLGKSTAFKVRNVEFRGFGDVFDLAVGSVDRGAGLYAYQTQAAYAFARYAPTGDVLGGSYSPTGVGLLIDTSLFPRSTSTIGPAVDISFCKFYRCERVYGFGSDTVAHGRLDFHKNVLEGTYGGFDLNSTSLTEIYAAGNEWFGLGPAYGRTAPANNANSFHTLFKIGIDDGIDINLRTQKVYLENNYAHDIEDQNTSTNTNAGVFCDVRQVTPTTFTNTGTPELAGCDISISYNAIIDVRNTRGHEDSNALYGKMRGGVIERNYIKNCGAADARPGFSGDGSEGTGAVFKDPAAISQSPANSFMAFRGNVFEDMPANTNTPGSLCVVKLSDFAPLNVIFIGNQFYNCHNTVATGENGLLRHYNGTGKVSIWANELFNCNLATRFINFHEFTTSVTGHEVSNNVAHNGADVNYTGNLTLIRFGGSISSLSTGLNVLDGTGGDYVMLSTPAGSGTAGSRTYTAPTVTVGGSPVATPVFSVGSGTYTTTQSVTITSGTSGATIRYTTDGSTPSSTSGAVYSAAVSISATTTLKAIAYKSGMTDSAVTTATYTFTTTSGPFQMAANQVVMEAENFTSKTAAGGVDWSLITESGASGAASNNAIVPMPNTGAGSAAPGAGVARVDYQFDAPAGSSATFYVHIRSRGPTTVDDSVWLSIDGSTSTYQQLNFANTLVWRTSTSTFAIGAGTHALTVWLREDGAIMDKIVISSSATQPTGTGPAESAHSSGGGAVSAPGFSPAAGSYSSAQSVAITSATSGATIRYTTDGSTPTSSTGTVYSSPVSITSTATLKAIAYKTGMTDSTVTSGSYTISVAQVAAPTFSPTAGSFDTAQLVAISTSTSGATIRYTTDGSTPTQSVGTVYSSAVSVSSTTTLKAIAYKAGMTDSAVTSGAYTIRAFQMSASEVVMEAEHYTSKTAASGVDWNSVTDASASGSTAMQALPNTGAGSAAPGSTVARLDFQINVPTAGSYYVHARTIAATTTDDSIWVSIDGGTVTYQQMGALTTGYSWRTSGSSFAIPAGLHSITVWMREDGIVVDKLVVKSSSTAPTGTGPAESTRS
jgi:hypothetical protein